METLPRAVELLRRHDWIPWVVSLVAFWVVSTRVGFTGVPFQGASRRQFVGRHELYTLVAVGLVVSGILAVPGKGVAGRILANRVLLYLGLISFGFYLYHFAVVDQLDEWLDIGGPAELGLFVHFALALLGAAAIASVSYFGVERPALRLKGLVSPPPAKEGVDGDSGEDDQRDVGGVTEPRDPIPHEGRP
jgi:peptidoglycan/LPS O-acetylase OafA/YrhL